MLIDLQIVHHVQDHSICKAASFPASIVLHLCSVMDFEGMGHSKGVGAFGHLSKTAHMLLTLPWMGRAHTEQAERWLQC